MTNPFSDSGDPALRSAGANNPSRLSIVRRGEFCGLFTPMALTADGMPDFRGVPHNPDTAAELRGLQAPVRERFAPELSRALAAGEMEREMDRALRDPKTRNGAKLTGSSFRFGPSGTLCAQQVPSDYVHVLAARALTKKYVKPKVMGTMTVALSLVSTIENDPGSFYPGDVEVDFTGSFNEIPLVRASDGKLRAVLAVKAAGQHLEGALGMFGGMADPADIVDGSWIMSAPGSIRGTASREMMEETSRPPRRLLSAFFGSQPDMQNTVIGVELTGLTEAKFEEGVRASPDGLNEHSKLVSVALPDIPKLAASPYRMAPWLGSALGLLGRTIMRAPELEEYRSAAIEGMDALTANPKIANAYWRSVVDSPGARSIVAQMGRVPLMSGVAD